MAYQTFQDLTPHICNHFPPMLSATVIMIFNSPKCYLASSFEHYFLLDRRLLITSPNHTHTHTHSHSFTLPTLLLHSCLILNTISLRKSSLNPSKDRSESAEWRSTCSSGFSSIRESRVGPNRILGPVPSSGNWLRTYRQEEQLKGKLRPRGRESNFPK